MHVCVCVCIPECRVQVRVYMHDVMQEGACRVVDPLPILCLAFLDLSPSMTKLNSLDGG